MPRCMLTRTLTEEIEDYCRRAGLSPSTLCVKVLGNSRYFDRLKRRGQRLEAEAEKLRAFMAANPPSSHRSGAA